MNADDLKVVLEKHRLYLNNADGGERAVLRGDNLRGANLSWADLRGADLSGADLSDANLRGADLSDAKVSEDTKF